MSDFLLEIGLEEIPARMIEPAEEELYQHVTQMLLREKLLSEVRGSRYSTPRRLAVLVHGVLPKQEDIEEELIGPSCKVAYKDGVPTPAAEAFAKKAGVTVTDLKRITNPKGEYVAATIKRIGRTAEEVLAEYMAKEISTIYWPKNMYWRPWKPERFVRPLRWMVAILDQKVIPFEFAGITASNTSRGHRILYGDSPLTIASPNAYVSTLEVAKVIVDPVRRKQEIRKALDAKVHAIPGAQWREDEELLRTVTHLTEYPSVLLGCFEAEYLSLPEEVLVTVMRDHQKYFAVEDASGKLAPHFLAILNTDGDSEGLIRHGNERVLRARFNDARFFWNYDQKIQLADRVEMLKSVTFQKELGSYWEKTQATLRMAKALAGKLISEKVALDEEGLMRAVLLSKTDLTTELVKEFTELQGIVGGLYARAQGLGEAVAQAIYWQYSPASSEDAIPPTVEGQVLGLADRIQTIVEMFAIGLAPTGSKDPFALRRAASAIIKILAETMIPLPLNMLVTEALNVTGRPDNGILEFLRERLHYYLKEVRGFSYDVVNAVLAAGADDVPDAIGRCEALTAVRGSEDFAAISIAFKRIKNILRQAGETGEGFDARFVELVPNSDPAEKQLLAKMQSLAPQADALRYSRQYKESLEMIATLRPAIDTFFDKVMVMAPEEELRRVRLRLIGAVLQSFTRIADFSEIVTG
jgi:glycyl-tRNA synthetase beta chain